MKWTGEATERPIGRCAKSLVQLAPETTLQNFFSFPPSSDVSIAVANFLLQSGILANFNVCLRALMLTCQTRVVLRERQEPLVHFLGAGCKDCRCDARNVLRVGAKNFRCCRLGTCFDGGRCCYGLCCCRFDFGQQTGITKYGCRNRSRSLVDDFAVINFDGVDGIDDNLSTFAGNFHLNFLLLQVTDSEHNIVALYFSFGSLLDRS